MELNLMTNKILQAQEEERRRINRELHDEMGQSLTAISVLLASLQPNGGTEPEHLSQTITCIQRMIEATMERRYTRSRPIFDRPCWTNWACCPPCVHI